MFYKGAVKLNANNGHLPDICVVSREWPGFLSPVAKGFLSFVRIPQVAFHDPLA